MRSRVSATPERFEQAPVHMSIQEIFKERRLKLERFLHRLLRNSDDAADVAQEAFLRVYAAEVGGKTPASEALLYTVAKNLALSELRKKTSRATDTVEDIEQFGLMEESPGPERLLQQRQMLAIIESAMARMPERCLEAFRLRKIDGLSHAEIAQHMGISVKTVERHITQALQLCHDQVRTNATRQPPAPARGSA